VCYRGDEQVHEDQREHLPQRRNVFARWGVEQHLPKPVPLEELFRLLGAIDRGWGEAVYGFAGSVVGPPQMGRKALPRAIRLIAAAAEHADPMVSERSAATVTVIESKHGATTARGGSLRQIGGSWPSVSAEGVPFRLVPLSLGVGGPASPALKSEPGKSLSLPARLGPLFSEGVSELTASAIIANLPVHGPTASSEKIQAHAKVSCQEYPDRLTKLPTA
jgi:hypothetical protein